MAVWVRCSCGEWWCTIHHQHAHDCPCPPCEEWNTDPYDDDTPPRPTAAAVRQWRQVRRARSDYP